MNVDKYRVQVTFQLTMPAGSPELTPEEREVYRTAARGTLSGLFPNDQISYVPAEERPMACDVDLEVLLANRSAQLMGGCERIVRELRKNESVFYVRVEALMFFDSATPVHGGIVPVYADNNGNWLVVSTAKYYANEGVTTETMLPFRFITTLMSYSNATNDSVYASRVMNEVIRSVPDQFVKIDSIYRLYRYGERHEIKFTR